MLQFLLAFHFVLTILIIGLIMLQKHDSDGALGSSAGGAASGMFSVRGQANILTKSTAVLMAVFMINCLIMAKITKRSPQKGSVIDRAAAQFPSEAPAGTVNHKQAPMEAPAEAPSPIKHTRPIERRQQAPENSSNEMQG